MVSPLLSASLPFSPAFYCEAGPSRESALNLQPLLSRAEAQVAPSTPRLGVRQVASSRPLSQALALQPPVSPSSAAFAANTGAKGWLVDDGQLDQPLTYEDLSQWGHCGPAIEVQA